MEHTGNKTENTKAKALITAVHRERYEILVAVSYTHLTLPTILLV